MTQEEAKKMHGYSIGYIAKCKKNNSTEQRKMFERSFKDNLKTAMKQIGMSQKELSDKTGMTEATISRYVKGYRYPSGFTVVLLSDALDVTTDYLLKGI